MRHKNWYRENRGTMWEVCGVCACLCVGQLLLTHLCSPFSYSKQKQWDCIYIESFIKLLIPLSIIHNIPATQHVIWCRASLFPFNTSPVYRERITMIYLPDIFQSGCHRGPLNHGEIQLLFDDSAHNSWPCRTWIEHQSKEKVRSDRTVGKIKMAGLGWVFLTMFG